MNLPSSGNDSRSATMAQRMNFKLKCTWAMQQDKDPVNTPATSGGFERDKLKVLDWLS